MSDKGPTVPKLPTVCKPPVKATTPAPKQPAPQALQDKDAAQCAQQDAAQCMQQEPAAPLHPAQVPNPAPPASDPPAQVPNPVQTHAPPAPVSHPNNHIFLSTCTKSSTTT